MLNGKEIIVLEYLYRECYQVFKIIEIKDIEDHCHSFKNCGKINLPTILDRLCSLGYIDIKYNDESVYCVMATSLCKLTLENEKIEEKTKRKFTWEIFIAFILISLFAFIGAFVGTLICNIFI